MSMEFKRGDILVNDKIRTIVIYSYTDDKSGKLFFLSALHKDSRYIEYTSTGVGYTIDYRIATESEKTEMIEELNRKKQRLN